MTRSAGGGGSRREDAIYTKYQEVFHELFDYAKRCARSENLDADADEIAQLAMFALWKKRHDITDWDNLRSWVRKVTRNLCTDHRRKNAKNPVSLGSSTDIDPFSQSVTDEERIEMREVTAHLRFLNEKQRLVICMQALNELTIEEIARRLDCSPRTVSRLLDTARAKLRHLVGRERAKDRRRSAPDPPVPRTDHETDLDGEGSG